MILNNTIMFWLDFPLPQGPFFRSIFHRISRCLPNPSFFTFLGDQSARLSSKVRFWSDFRFSWDPKIRSGSACDPPERVGAVLSTSGTLSCTAPYLTHHLLYTFTSLRLCSFAHSFVLLLLGYLPGANWGGFSEPPKLKMGTKMTRNRSDKVHFF